MQILQEQISAHTVVPGRPYHLTCVDSHDLKEGVLRTKWIDSKAQRLKSVDDLVENVTIRQAKSPLDFDLC